MRKQHKEDSSSWKIIFRKSSIRGSVPKDSSVRGRSPRWKDTFGIDDKGREIYHMQNTETWFQEEQWSQGEHE
jgi:hypothetical protein